LNKTTNDALELLLAGKHSDPFELLGLHPCSTGWRVRSHQPYAASVTLTSLGVVLERIGDTDIFEGLVESGQLEVPYRLTWEDGYGCSRTGFDPYSFGPVLEQSDLDSFNAGTHRRAHYFLGAHPCEHQGVRGVVFAVWAPTALRVSVVGDFNAWDGRTHAMRVRGESGVWELFVPLLEPGILYKFEVCASDGGLKLKSDPYGRAFELRPATAPIVAAKSSYKWSDESWMSLRCDSDWRHEAMSIYEVHLGSWRKRDDGWFLDYQSLADQLVAHVLELGFTHIELMPLTEHPLDASWGYQTIGFFAPTSRFGPPDGLRALVDAAHAAGIGVLLDWVPGHFPKDAHGLARYDGAPLYEHADVRRSEHPEWGTLTFDYARHEVTCFLLSSACYWLEAFHIDGLRVDAVASMLYLDYAREPGDWTPNEYGGRENIDAIHFMRTLNECIHGEFPGAVVIAEESTSWPQVTRPTHVGGLGFSMKWSMGWMHDTLNYLATDPVYRGFHHEKLTFGMMYNHTENFVLPFSHDEVVHEKRSLLGRMPGDKWQQLANLRILYAYQFTYPGKKLLFMGAELAAEQEWDYATELNWALLADEGHAGIARLLADLNSVYRDSKPLHQLDFEERGFEWIDCHDSTQSVLSYLRFDDDGNYAVVVVNFTPVPRFEYAIGVPGPGFHVERLNTDAAMYGGSGLGNFGGVDAREEPLMGRSHVLSLTLPPLAVVVLESTLPPTPPIGV
jgi:1,4-alpha-glucan branching enzyme